MSNTLKCIKILVIDDEVHIRQSFADFLEDREYHVVLAENGRRGLELLEREKPGLVLVDLRMPEVDGLEFLERGKSIAPDTPMIVISGANRIEHVVRALRCGAWDYLEKPVKDLSFLGHAVERALEKAQLKKENKLYQLHLEKMVNERTLELEKTNNHLAHVNDRLQGIVETTQGLTGYMETEQFSLQVLAEFAKHMGATGGSLYMVENDGLRLAHTLDPGHAADFLAFPLAEKSILGMVLDQGRPLLMEDIRAEGDVVSSGWSGYPDSSFLAFPIPDISGSIIGVITLHGKKEPPFTGQDREIGAILASYCSETFRAITAFEEVKKSEKQLRQAQKMEAIGTLAGGIAHDFNNILSGILGYAQLIDMNPEQTVAVRQHVGQIVKGARRASDLVNQILTFSRQADYERQPLKIHLIVKEAVKFLRSSIPATIQIVEDVHTSKLILADATQIHQVVMNLCTNGYHAMSDSGGILSVALHDKVVDEKEIGTEYKPGTYVLLEIRDTGHGISKEDMDKIFDPYFTTKKVNQGTGLGLAVVDGIVKKHDGFIRVESQPDVGTRFQVYFPVSEEFEPESAGTDIKFASLQGSEVVMVVEDEEDILDTTRRILESLGYAVKPFQDAASAFAAFEKSPDRFDIVVTDMAMPGITGRVMADKILKIRKDIPIILCSGYHESCDEKTLAQTSIRRFVQKPVSGSELALIIREELARREDVN